MNEQDPNRGRVEPSLGAGLEPPAPAARVPPRSTASTDAPGWERSVLEKLVMATVVEQRRARRWKIFFRLAGLGVALVFLAFALGWLHPTEGTATAGRHTAVIELDGVLASGGEVDADAVIAALRSAFKDTATAAVVLRINSPGGSPVQAGMISDEVRRLKAAHPDRPVYASPPPPTGSSSTRPASSARSAY
jgi:protease-4